MLGMTEKIRIVMLKRKVTVTELASKLGYKSQSSLSDKFRRDNFAEHDLQKIAEALDCDFEAHFVLRDTGEKV